jgi:hypothetical protein
MLIVVGTKLKVFFPHVSVAMTGIRVGSYLMVSWFPLMVPGVVVPAGVLRRLRTAATMVAVAAVVSAQLLPIRLARWELPGPSASLIRRHRLDNFGIRWCSGDPNGP